MDANARSELVERLRAARDELPSETDASDWDDDPGTHEVIRRWAVSLGLRRGQGYTPPARELGIIIERWSLERGWPVPVPHTAVGQVLRRLGFRRRAHHTLLGYRVELAQARPMWEALGKPYPARPVGAKAPRYEPRRRAPLPLLSELTGPQWTTPLLDSTAAIWPGTGWAAKALGCSPSLLAKAGTHTDRRHGHPAAGRLWWRLPKDRLWLAHVPPDARVGQPGVLCWCCWAKAEREQAGANSVG